MSGERKPIFTIGHSTHAIDVFVAILARHGVTAIADVRSSPYSRFNPHYNREALSLYLKQQGLAYVFLGRELGARSEDETCYVNGRVQYSRLACTAAFRQGLTRVTSGAQEHVIALMCAEKDPLDCHRTLLVARALDGLGASVVHILEDGRLETHAAAMERLLTVTGVPSSDMFLSKEELLAEALKRQESKIAYVDTTRVSGPEGGA